MVYIYTLQKELPGYDKGGTFRVEITDKGVLIENNVNGKYEDIRSLISSDNCDKWFTREIDESALTDCKCPKCGESRGMLYTNKGDLYDDGVRYYYITVRMECICGNKYKLGKFYTHCKLER